MRFQGFFLSKLVNSFLNPNPRIFRASGVFLLSNNRVKREKNRNNGYANGHNQ